MPPTLLSPVVQDTVREYPYRQAQAPSYFSGSFVLDDADNHDFGFPSGGKHQLTIVVENPGDVTVTVQLYGAPNPTADVGNAGVLAIGASWTITDAENRDDQEYANVEKYPYYIVRLTSSGAAAGSPTCTFWCNLHPG